MGNLTKKRLRTTCLAALAALTLAGAAGCDETPTSPAPAFEQTEVRVGTGDPAENGDTLTVFYTGWLYDPTKLDQKGLRFESNAGGTGFAFVLGSGQVIAGWDDGLQGIQAGGIRRLVIPPALAYGTVRNGPIPPNSTLVFEVEVTTIQPPASSQ